MLLIALESVDIGVSRLALLFIIETINTAMRLYEFTGRTIEEMLAEIDRRGFLKGLGATAATAAVPSISKAGIIPDQYIVKGSHGVEAHILAWSEKGAIEKAQNDPKYRNELFKNATARKTSDAELNKQEINRKAALDPKSDDEIKSQLNKLKAGMPDFEVRSLLGPPIDKKLSTVRGIKQEHEIQIWYYPKGLKITFANGHIFKMNIDK